MAGGATRIGPGGAGVTRTSAMRGPGLGESSQNRALRASPESTVPEGCDRPEGCARPEGGERPGRCASSYWSRCPLVFPGAQVETLDEVHMNPCAFIRL